MSWSGIKGLMLKANQSSKLLAVVEQEVAMAEHPCEDKLRLCYTPV